ncbi:hypothetical protein ACEK17_002501 [Salmonella enterica subsp. enterica serovar Newport]|nr:hypothetical protein [Salmonella enterica subsp. enterica serovar Kottbus]ECF2419926.1 hypothetical protein [Salmonella enterica subsp. enterica serovar Newport]ECH3772617.1 hypothetical protein [Salmonella enterica subsp. enterica]ECM2621628.1 hypothetical protein [Salmonella enterica subsp. enterica serovar Newport]ECN7517370.1 hypothetical protein [Salmonella enterica subsp. enterica serovar Newport]
MKLSVLESHIVVRVNAIKGRGGLTPVSTPSSSEDLTARDLIQVLNSIFCAVMETSSDINKKISPQNLLKVMKALELLMKPSD